MRKRECDFLLVLGFFTLVGASQSWASVTTVEGALCTLSQPAMLFVGKDGQKTSARVPVESQLTLKVGHAARWMVETSQGQLGFIDRSVLTSARCSLPPSFDAPKSATSDDAPNLDAGDLSETAAALELTRVVAEGADVAPELVQGQLAKVAETAAARDLGRATTGSRLLRVAVYDLDLTNISTGLGKATTDALLNEIRKLEGVSAIGMDEVREMLDFEAQRQSLGCDADDQCLAEIAGALGVDELITGSLREEAAGRSIVVKRIDQRRAEVRNTFNKRLAIGTGEEFLLALGDTVSTLYPKRPYRPGSRRGVSKKVVLRLNPPPVPAWVTFTTFGASVASFGAAGLFSYLAYLEHQDFVDPSAFTAGEPPPSAQYVSMEQHGKAYESTAMGMAIAGGVSLVGGVVMSLFTDWLGEEDADE